MLLPAPEDNTPPMAKPWHDKATDKDAMPVQKLEGMLASIAYERDWRTTSDLCCDYYDGKQMTQEQAELAQRSGIDFKACNLIRVPVNATLGTEATGRRDPKIESDDDDMADVADVGQVKLKEAQRETYADTAISNAYASDVKAGIGWVEVSRNTDPFGYPYRVQDIHRNLIFWDRQSKRLDLSDCRWILRKEWRDLDELMATFPHMAEILRQASGGWAGFLSPDAMLDSFDLNSAFEAYGRFMVRRDDWLDTARKMICTYEVWYRVPKIGIAMKVGNRWVDWDRNNPAHLEAARRGMVELRKGPTMQMRQAMYAGPFRLLDRAVKRRRFPYIPFFAYRTDKDGEPYGMIHAMLGAQDDYNDRYQRIQWLMRSVQMFIESDAVDTDYNNVLDIAQGLMRPDLLAVMKPGKLGAIKLQNALQLQPEQLSVMENAKNLIHETGGVFPQQMGTTSGATSGLAINSLVQQGVVSQAELNDNYSLGRQLTYEALLDLIIEDHMRPNMQVRIGSGDSRRVVILNTFDPKTGEPKNVVADAAIRTGLSEIPSTPAAQMQQSQQLASVMTSMAGSPAINLLLPAWVESTSAFGANRKQIAEDMRRMAGLPTSGDRQGAEQWKAQQQEQAAKTAAINEQAAQVKLMSEQAAAALKEAQATLARANAAKASIEAQLLAAQPSEDQLIAGILQEAAGRPAGTAP